MDEMVEEQMPVAASPFEDRHIVVAVGVLPDSSWKDKTSISPVLRNLILVLKQIFSSVLTEVGTELTSLFLELLARGEVLVVVEELLGHEVGNRDTLGMQWTFFR